jgi:hypothetical protein
MRPAILAAVLAVLAQTIAIPAAGEGLRLVQMRGAILACSGDYFRLCPGVRPGGGRIIVCLNSQAEKLSQPCFQALAERGLAFAAALRLCRPDYERLCPGVPVGMGRALACLLDNFQKISPPCRDALSAHGFSEGESEVPAPPAPGGAPGREEPPWRRR